MKIAHFIPWRIYCSARKNEDIRIKLVNSVINNWGIYNQLVICDNCCRFIIYNSNHYDYLMSFLVNVEPECISRLYVDTAFRVNRSNDHTEFIIYCPDVKISNFFFWFCRRKTF